MSVEEPATFTWTQGGEPLDEHRPPPPIMQHAQETGHWAFATGTFYGEFFAECDVCDWSQP